MTVQRDVGLQFALVKEILDPTAQKRQVEEKIRAVEQRNKRFLENAARLDMHSYMESKPQTTLRATTSDSQLLLGFENNPVSEHS